MVARFLTAALLVLLLLPVRVAAERPIADLHRLDAYFALFAGDSNVPWSPTLVRLDTYTSAPVQFSVYQVDPADVLTAGSNARPRVVDTRGRHAIASFNFTPPGGYQFQSNEVDVQLGSRTGFFVVEARRGDVGEQVWINRTRVGLVAKETPGEVVLYGTDLGTGRALAHMRVQFVVNRRFASMETDAHGVVRWSRQPRPLFALAQWGESYAFVSLLPQAPLPSAIVGVRTDSAVVHAGDTIRVVGFARTRDGNVLRPSSGTASVSVRAGAGLIGEQRVELDGAGAFTAAFPLAQDAAAGDYTVLAQAAGGVGGATVHVDANAAGLALEAASSCNGTCDAAHDVPLLVHSSRAGIPVHVTVVRSPHVYIGYTPELTPWATTRWLDTVVRTGDDGNATVMIPHPNDELGSTYGVRVDAGGATADTRIVVPTSQAAIRVQLDRQEASLGTPIGFDVYANDVATGKPLPGANVTVQLVHGASIQQQVLVLDGAGHARASFSSPQLGTNLVFARVDDGGRAMDAAQVQVDAQAPAASFDGASPNVHIALDKSTYRSGDVATITASAPQSQGQALITLESAAGVQATVAENANGRAVAHFRVADATGELRVGAGFVRNGAIEWSTIPLVLDGPGRPQSAALSVGTSTLTAGEPASVAFRDAPTGAGTVVVRISRGAPSGSALFDSAPDLLAIGVTTTQSSAAASTTWHPWVDSTGDHAQILGFVRRTQPPAEVSLAQAETQAVSWVIAHQEGGAIAVQMPAHSGNYTLSVLDISNDGSVTAGSQQVVVR
jgi:hypothetical protein